jgi:hypothetical protein
MPNRDRQGIRPGERSDTPARTSYVFGSGTRHLLAPHVEEGGRAREGIRYEWEMEYITNKRFVPEDDEDEYKRELN